MNEVVCKLVECKGGERKLIYQHSTKEERKLSIVRKKKKEKLISIVRRNCLTIPTRHVEGELILGGNLRERKLNLSLNSPRDNSVRVAWMRPRFPRSPAG